MKNSKIILSIILGFIIGALATNVYASYIKLIKVPEYIGNYKTVDLLEYVMKQKQKEDAQKVEEPAKATPEKENKKDKIENSKIKFNNANM